MQAPEEGHIPPPPPPPPFQCPPLNGIDLFDSDLESLQGQLRSGKITSTALTQHCLNRIHATNKFLECVVEINPDALSIARQSDERRQDGQFGTRSIFDGIPVLLKDNMATNDQMETTAGSWSLLGSRPIKDSSIAARLRAAGAVVIGKTVMEEWAGVRSTVYAPGYSTRGHLQTRNPYDLMKEPSGSSGGSAVAVAANLVPVAFGTETDGSIIWPAMKNGIVGIKPSLDLVSTKGIVPISRNFDVAGPLARTVKDAAYALDIVAGNDPGAERATEREHDLNGTQRSYSEYAKARAENLKGARFGLPMRRCFDLVRQDHQKVAKRVLDALRSKGAEITEVDFPSIDERIDKSGEWDWRHDSVHPSRSEITVINTDFHNDLQTYLHDFLPKGSTPSDIHDVIAYNLRNRGTEAPLPSDHNKAFPTGQDGLEQAAATHGIENDEYQEALRWIREQCKENGIDAALNGFSFTLSQQGSQDGFSKLDALILIDRKGVGMQYAAQAGYPIISIPIGLDDEGMPVGLSLQHTFGKERELIRWASAIEDLLLSNVEEGGRKRVPIPPPQYRNYREKRFPVAVLE